MMNLYERYVYDRVTGYRDFGDDLGEMNRCVVDGG